MADIETKFWETKGLEDMSPVEWEQLCDHCGLCCLVRIEDADSGEIYDTNIVCRHYDCKQSCCTSYDSRQRIAHGCEPLTPALVREYDWLPDSCAYRTVMRGEPLPDTHPLMGGKGLAGKVVRQFAGLGVVQDSDHIDPACHLIALQDIG